MLLEMRPDEKGGYTADIVSLFSIPKRLFHYSADTICNVLSANCLLTAKRKTSQHRHAAVRLAVTSGVLIFPHQAFSVTSFWVWPTIGRLKPCCYVQQLVLALSCLHLMQLHVSHQAEYWSLLDLYYSI